MLASACSRGGRRRDEAVAHYCAGVLHENQGQPARAVASYRRMLAAAEAAQDPSCEAIAHNCLGVSLLLLGEAERSALHHERHLELCDSLSRFAAHLNLGLARAALGELEAAVGCFREALRHSIRSGTLAAESTACGNLAHACRMTGDTETARASLERYLRLTSSLRDERGEVDAHMRFGALALDSGDLRDAGTHFETALGIASAAAPSIEAQLAVNETKIDLGMAAGQQQFDEFMASAFRRDAFA